MMRDDNEILRQNLSIEARQSKILASATASDHIARLQDQSDMYGKKIEIEKRRVDELDKEILKIRAAIMEQKIKANEAKAKKNSHVR
jgi:hypothetical protein